MPFPFSLPTTSTFSFPDYFRSSTHPSLPLTATTQRGVFRAVLKRYKRLPATSQPSDLSNVLAALNEYIPYLFALDAGLSGSAVAGEEVDIILEKELELEWRATLTQYAPGREPARVKLQSLEYEIFFVLQTLAYTYTLLAKSQLWTLYAPTTPTTEQRTTAITTATKYLLQASSVHSYLLNRSGQWISPSPTIDISSPILIALSSLAHAEATLLAVLKDDPYPAIVAQSRNKNDKDWMIKAPDIPKVRAHLFARLCLAAADRAAKASAMLHQQQERAAGKPHEDFLRYADDLRKAARGRACRFFAIDADLGGSTGEAISWLRAGKSELGYSPISAADEKNTRGLMMKIKRDWTEKKEDKRIERGGEWGFDAGRLEEARVIDMLESKWVKMNDTINTQPIPPYAPLFAAMPSGREIHSSPTAYVPPELDEDVLARMRAPVEEETADGFEGVGEGDSSDDGGGGGKVVVGAFPGTAGYY
ncbi:MAG: hypothetical protein M1813_002919 [Trichoglossum hirsutum]|nr:MAG: hypothetical protein M1813_002919 [Trichoglossum hirsutum]